MHAGSIAAMIAAAMILPSGPASAEAAVSAGVQDVQRHEPATHATRGTVTSVDAVALVIVRPRHRGEMTFALLPSTTRDGTIVAGSTVSIRYREEPTRHIATAVAVERVRK